MKQYQRLLQDILIKGTLKGSSRKNMPNTMSLFGTRIEHDMADGYPLLTTKKMYWKGIVHELLWILRGDTNIKYLVDNNVNIWNQDAYRWYLKTFKDIGIEPYVKTIEDFVITIKNTQSEDLDIYGDYKLGDLGKVYGAQWRNQNGIDQVKICLKRLSEEPLGRYAIIDGWNPSDFDQMSLPPCHLLYQFNCRPIKGTSVFYLDLQMYQRSCDAFLGVPFNIASMALLLLIFSKVLNYIPGKIIWIGGDTHIYDNHLNQVNEQLSRGPLELPGMAIVKKLNSLRDIENLTIEDFVLSDYKSHPKIIAELKTGL